MCSGDVRMLVMPFTQSHPLLSCLCVLPPALLLVKLFLFGPLHAATSSERLPVLADNVLDDIDASLAASKLFAVLLLLVTVLLQALLLTFSMVTMASASGMHYTEQCSSVSSMSSTSVFFLRAFLMSISVNSVVDNYVK
uniref:Uncharacterized protein n=1 Tax=Lygus hesperus TaxID=30085 RepID=A0A146LWT1_LYGHE